jgi:hypothetical protein
MGEQDLQDHLLIMVLQEMAESLLSLRDVLGMPELARGLDSMTLTMNSWELKLRMTETESGQQNNSIPIPDS